MRLGTCRGKCSVKYYTVDASAVAGGKYVATNGCLEFKDGEALKSFSFPVIASDSFDTTLSFMVSLESPDNCKIEPRLQTTPVYIIDDNTFPTDKYKVQIHDRDQAELDTVGLGLLMEFAKYAFAHIPSIGWKSSVALLLDQLSNAQYLFTIFLRVYLVDV